MKLRLFILAFLWTNFYYCSNANYYKFEVGKTEQKEFYTTNTTYYWIGAFDACKVWDLELGVIESEEENELIVNYFKNNSYSQNDKFWIGATDYFHEGNFTQTKNQKELIYSNFEESPKNDVSKNCIIIRADGKWEYSECQRWSWEALPLCQKVIKDNINYDAIKSTMKTKYLTEIKQIGEVGRKYYYIEREDNGREFIEALDYCQEQGLNLATFRSEEEQEFILKISKELLEKNESYYIIWGAGANFYAKNHDDDGKNGHNFYWLKDGEKIIETKFIKLESGLIINNCIVVYPESAIKSIECAYKTSRTVCELSV